MKHVLHICFYAKQTAPISVRFIWEISMVKLKTKDKTKKTQDKTPLNFNINQPTQSDVLTWLHCKVLFSY